MRRTTTLLAAYLLAAGAVGCSSDEDNAKDCPAALTERTGGDSEDTPTVTEAQERVDALDDTLADMVRSGYENVAKDAADALEEKTKDGEKNRPGACDSLSEDDYTALLMAKSIDGLGWTDDEGNFAKNKMLDSVTEAQ
ncbi:hypothetical protein [Streptomyces sp. NPDC126514]|uniref:hypothetical protein n=1 Tax=Streptomyces sp. NPDC126514 TaxID=3155210 RepID=UPI003319BD58